MSSWEPFPIEPRRGSPIDDPYFDWARETGFAYYGDAEWLPMLIELKESATCAGTAQDFARCVFEMQAREPHERGWAAELIVPPIYASLPERLNGALTFLPALARQCFIDRVNAGGEPAGNIRRFEIGRALMPTTDEP
jgi:hypothetical protein